jgi:general secretion pathway protein H
MRTSATGRADRVRSEHGFTSLPCSAEHGFKSSWRSAENGFTLVELLIVVAMIGLLSAAVIIAMPDPRGSLTAEAERFAARAKAVRDRAIIDSRAMSIRVTAIGYGFDRRTDGEWEPLRSAPFVDQLWAEGVRAAIGASDAARIVFDSTGQAEPASIMLARDGEQVNVSIAQDGGIDVDG